MSIRVVDQPGSRWVTIERREAANALDEACALRIDEAVREAAEIPGHRAIVIRAEGRVFSAGTDLADLDACSDGDLTLRFLRVGSLLETVMAAPLLTIACVAGPAIGAGADLALACDHRLAEPAASFRFPGAGFGLVLGSRRLADISHPGFAAEIIASGRKVASDEALAQGLATEIVAAGSADGRAEQLVAGLTRLDDQTFRQVLEAVRPAPSRAGLADLAESLATNSGLKARMLAHRAAAISAKAGK